MVRPSGKRGVTTSARKACHWLSPTGPDGLFMPNSTRSSRRSPQALGSPGLIGKGASEAQAVSAHSNAADNKDLQDIGVAPLRNTSILRAGSVALWPRLGGYAMHVAERVGLDSD